MSAAESKDLPIILYNPQRDGPACSLQRHAALSHAAKVAAARRKRYRKSLPLKKVCDGIATSANQTGLVRQPSPENVDPSHSMAIKVTVEVSMLVDFWINFLASDMSKPDGGGKLTVAFVLDNELQARSLLYMCSALLSLRYPDSADVQVKLMRYRQSCFQSLLRLRARDDEPEQMEDLSEGLIQALVAACFANDQREASLHANHLIRELKAARKAKLLSEDEHFFVLARIHYWDVQCALYYARPPIIDPELTSYIWHPHFKPCAEWLAIQEISTRVPHSGVISSRLKYLFSKLQEYVY